MAAKNIDEVISQLDDVIERTRRQRSRLGYFAALYRKVTVNVKEGIDDGIFENGARMERLDVIFANRYLEASDNHWNGVPVTDSWRVAFAAANSKRITVLQHLLIGMNAHINLDLGIAAAQTSPGEQLPALKEDFNKINGVLASLVNGVKEELTELWPTLGFLDKLAGRTEDVMINFSMERAREHAWGFAEKLAPIQVAEQAEEIRKADKWVARFASVIRKPGITMRLANAAISLTERGTVAEKIDLLC